VKYLILLPIFIFALFQGAFLPLNLVLLTVLVWSAFAEASAGDKVGQLVFFVAFLGGLFLDLAKGTPLGFSSFLFLVLSSLLILYARRFNPTHPVFLPIFVFLSANLYSLIAYRFINWFEGLILAALALIFGFLGKYFLVEIDKEKIKLKV
jgi:hypothetical protein